MADKGFKYEFTMKELMYFLFKKKICPKCGGKMKKIKGKEIVSGRIANSQASSSDDFIFNANAEVSCYNYSYICERCNCKFSLEELANKK